MKLLYVQDSLGTGGAERSNAELWYYLKENLNVKLRVVVLEHRKEGIENEILGNGFDVTFLKPSNIINQVRELIAIIKNYKPDIVHSVLFRSAIRVRAARIRIKFFHVESIVNCSYSPIRFKDPKINSVGLKFYQYVNQLTQNKGTDLFIAITEEVKNHGIHYLKITPNKIKVIPRGRHPNPYLNDKIDLRAKLKKELGIEEESLIFIHVGRQEYQKGHMDVLQAILHSNDNLKNLNAHFIFCGRKGNATNEIKEFIKLNPLTVKSHWLGHRHDIPKLLVASDVFIFPSLFEGLGGSLIEAQAAALPIICSNIKVFEEVINNGENAIMFEQGNYKDLAAKLIKLGNSKSLQEQMGEKSLENYNNKFDIEKIHQRVYSLYKMIVF